MEASYLMRDRIRGVEVWETLGFDVKRCMEYVEDSEIMEVFCKMLFSRIVPTVKDIGLWGPKVQKAYKEMGVISFSEFPAVYGSNEVTGVRLRFESGRVVDASAATGEEFLLGTLDADEGARGLGELGIGCNPGITRHMKNVLFDEKIYGTVHLALGASYPFTGGTNVSSVHWDIVKDLRRGGRLSCDGEVVQENGAWLF